MNGENEIESFAVIRTLGFSMLCGYKNDDYRKMTTLLKQNRHYLAHYYSNILVHACWAGLCNWLYVQFEYARSKTISLFMLYAIAIVYICAPFCVYFFCTCVSK